MPELLVRLLHGGIDRALVPDVERERQQPVAVFHLQRIERADVAGCGGHTMGERQRGFGPDIAEAFGCTCDEPGLVRNGLGHGILSSGTLYWKKRRALRLTCHIRRTLRFTRGCLVKVRYCPLAPRRRAKEPRALTRHGIETVHLLEGGGDAFGGSGTGRRRHRFVVSPGYPARRLGRGGLPPLSFAGALPRPRPAVRDAGGG